MTGMYGMTQNGTVVELRFPVLETVSQPKSTPLDEYATRVLSLTHGVQRGADHRVLLRELLDAAQVAWEALRPR